MARGKSLKAEEIETLKEALVNYRRLAIQCSNTTFNMAQAMRGGEDRYETTFQLVRDFDRAENRLIEVLKDAGLFKSLADVNSGTDTKTEKP